jgi:hypothetical protein
MPGTGLEPAHLTATASKTVVSAIPPPGPMISEELADSPSIEASGEIAALKDAERVPPDI